MSENIPDLTGKTALVTGASRGIGRAAALALAKAGAHVLALARTVGGLEELDDEIRKTGGAASLIPMDLTEGDGIERLAEALGERFGKIDIVIANAAILGELAPLQDIEPKVWQKTLDLNVTANWRLIRAFDPLLRKSDDAHMVFLTSRIGGEIARAYWGVYAVSKAAMEMLAKTYGAETMKSNVTVAIVDPGAMRTSMRAQAMPGEDPASLPSPDELTPLLYKAVTDKTDGVMRLCFRDEG
jgi:NAD(P)-dependent dehydrogenase (short-subunit alcohol dehydrogenase family)